MACERYRDALKDAAAGAPALVELEAHLVGCAACRQELDALRRALALVDGDLRELLASEPAPDLAARIREAASGPLASAAWRPGFALQALAAGAVLAAALVVTRGSAPGPEPSAAVATPLRSASSAMPLPGPTPAPGPDVSPTAPARVAVPRRPRASARPVQPEPEVLVPPGGAEALVRLVTLLNRDRVAPPVMVAAGQAPPDLAELRSIDIAPLEIVPLDAAETTGT